MAGEEKRTVQQQLEEVRLQKELMELEDLTYRVQNERNRREMVMRNHKSQQDTIAKINRDIIAKQSVCKHKKGGKNLAGIVNGNSSDYSIWKHTYPWGAVEVICSRCGKTWNKPAIALRKSDPKAYRAQMEEYNEAINWPTDNEPSGSVLFAFTYEQPESASGQQRA